MSEYNYFFIKNEKMLAKMTLLDKIITRVINMDMTENEIEQLNKARNRLKQMRKEKHLTLEKAADLIGVQKSAYRKMELGITKGVKISYIQKLADFYQVNPAWLCGYDVSKYITMKNKYILEITEFIEHLSERDLKKVLALLKEVFDE